MRFTPKSEKEIQEERFPVLKPGRYHFEVMEAKEDVSKKGNSMIVLKLKILDDGLNVRAYINDYLMENISYKLRHAAIVCGLGDAYNAGELHAHMFAAKGGVVELGIQRDKTGQYPDKNSVLDYVQNEPRKEGDWDMTDAPDWVR